MKKRQKMISIMMSVVLVLCGLLAPVASAATVDYVNITKTVNPASITVLEESQVNLTIKGTPPVNVIVPNDVILIIDKSGSMAPTYQPNQGEDKMTNAKEAAKGFIDLMDLTKHRVGIVDFSSTGMIGSYPLSTDKTAVKNYISGIQSNGGTATGDGISVATGMLADHRPEAQPVIVILTDGDATEPKGTAYEYAIQKALEAKEAGIVFYTIALLNPNDNPDTSGPNKLLKDMATTAAHHHFVLGSTGLSEIYAAIVQEIGQASAYDVVVKDVIDPNFELVHGSADANIPKPTINGNELTWSFKELKNSELNFTYKIRPVDKTKTGTFAVSTADSVINYKDYAGAQRTKAVPSANVTVKLPAPIITSIVEPSGHPNGGETVTINGEYFVPGATVVLGAATATNVTVVSPTQITVTAPASVQGTVNVTVTNPDKQKATGTYQYKADPIVTAITPDNGPLEGGTTVIFNGNYFMKGLSVKFGEIPATIVINASATYLKVTSPMALTPGLVPISITNPDGTSVTISDAFRYNEPPKTDPVINSISPATDTVAGGIAAYIEGKYLTNAMKASIGNKAATTTFLSDTRLKVTIPAADIPGVVDVILNDGNGNILTLPAAFTYTAIQHPVPTITSVSPNQGLVNGGESIYVNGTNFISKTTKVFIGGKEASSTYLSNTRLKVIVPAGDAAGFVDVKVTNVEQEAVAAQAYEYTNPVVLPITITGISPNTGPTTGGTTIYIDGTNFNSGAVVTFGTAQVNATFLSDTRLKAVAPASSTTGFVDVTVTTKDGATASLISAYEYTAVQPTITGLSVDHANKAGGDIVYVYGTNFEASAKVTVNGVNATFAFIGPTSLKVTIPASPTTGVVPLMVTLANGQSASTVLTYDNGPLAPAPTITSLNVNSGSAGSIFYITGTNFTSASKVYVGSTLATKVYLSATRIKVTVPVGSGVQDVTVVNADGQVSNAVTFTVN
ncbi:IPT/TIG domain-containing protein [Paenibacillus harenae]|uniref:IPT/TIG domain-containing protein n=1 Tax=Paenibacillus harenae TaxID=306543 RepID=UPI00040C0ABF|nr:IPT/TIG domain-containing protein [Paenibacillus harenae]